MTHPPMLSCPACSRPWTGLRPARLLVPVKRRSRTGARVVEQAVCRLSRGVGSVQRAVCPQPRQARNVERIVCHRPRQVERFEQIVCPLPRGAWRFERPERRVERRAGVDRWVQGRTSRG